VAISVNSEASADNLRRVAIDRSLKGPVLFLFTNAAFWLMASTVLGVVAAMNFVVPGFLQCEYLSYGRIQPAHISALVYGWGIQVGLGVGLWLVARRCAVELKSGQGMLILFGVIWNIGVTLGVAGILFGGNTSKEWLEFPTFVWPILTLAFLGFAWRIVSMYAHAQRTGGFMITAQYIVAACFWFPWVFVTANLALNHMGNLGAIGSGINAWYVHSIILLFFVPVGVGSTYYFIPKITGQPIYSSQLANMGFWMLAILGGWSGMQRFMGGPLPAWMPSVGSMVGVLMLIPVGLVAWNHHLTTLGAHRQVAISPALRFTFFGALFYPISSIMLALISSPVTGFSFQFTHAWYGFQIISIYGFFSMCAFGAIYYIVPRLAGCEWLSVRLINNHFWFSVYGVAAIVVMSMVSGLQQGAALNNPNNWNGTFYEVVMGTRGYIVARVLAWSFILWSNIWFLIHLLLMVAGLGRRSSAATLLGHDDHESEATIIEGAKA
jgi:cytochrome c oxidase cbb3-type subunit 1